jgi:hypothetical protein
VSASPRSARNAGVRRRRLAAAVVSAWFVAVCGIVAPAGIANADCTGAGDYGAGSGCAPPGDSSGSGGGESWPPTAVDWPPSQSSNSNSDSGGSDAGAGGDSMSTPIVMPDGQQAPLAKHSESKSTSTPPTPIVPVGAPSPEKSPDTIVTASGSTP